MNDLVRLSILLTFTAVFFSCSGPSSRNQSAYAKNLPAWAGRSELKFEGQGLLVMGGRNVSALVCGGENQETEAFFFNGRQKSALEKLVRRREGASLEVTVSNLDGTDDFSGDVKFGFIYDCGGVSEPGVSFSFRSLGKKTVGISMCLPEDISDMIGFYVCSDTAFSVEKVSSAHARIGMDVSSEIPLYAFGRDGGTVDGTNLSVDFSDGKNLFDRSNGRESVLPKIEMTLAGFSELPADGGMDRLSFSYGGSSFVLRRSPAANAVTLQSSSVRDAFSVMELKENPSLLKSVFMTSNGLELCPSDGTVDEPFVTDVGLILEWPRSKWRTGEYELFRWELFPDVLIFDFKDYDVQNLFMSRIAYFTEKDGYRGTFIDDESVKTLHGYNAHDYKADDLAEFFTVAAGKKLSLNEKERLLRNILIKNGIIVDAGDGKFLAGKGAVISLSRESPMDLRTQLLAHETWHGIYFMDAGFREFSDSVYASTKKKARDFLKLYFKSYDSLGYDTGDEYLMRNEFMAYMLQQSPKMTVRNFQKISTWSTLALRSPELSGYMQKTECSDFLDASERLCGYVSERWGLWGGRTHLLSKE